MNVSSLLEQLDNDYRSYIYDDKDVDFEKHFTYVDKDRKLLSFANDASCMTSDAYIMYIIGLLGACDRKAINNALNALKRVGPDLSIAESLDERLRALYKGGWLFKLSYDVVNYTNGVKDVNTIALYTLTDDGCTMVKQQLPKSLSSNTYIQAKPIKELIGWASAAYTGSVIAYHCLGFNDFLERVLRTKMIGSYYFPCEVKVTKTYSKNRTGFVDGKASQMSINETHRYYIANISAFYFHDKTRFTQNDYENIVADKLNFIIQYLNCRTGLTSAKTKPEDKHAVVVVTVKDKHDLAKFCESVMKVIDRMESYLPSIYITGEGIIEKSSDIKDCFMQMTRNRNTESGFSLTAAIPDFV